MSKISLSYSTLNATIHSPHVYLNKLMGLKTFSIQAFADGHKIHRLIQDHCSGVTPHPLLVNTPAFSLVETEDFDEKMKIEFDINDKYKIIGYVDMKDPDTGRFGEIKSGKPWSAGEFARSPQWKIYAVGMPEYRQAYLINTPKDLSLWTPDTIRIFSKDITEEDKEQARIFIRQGLHVIENIKEEVDIEMNIKKEKGWNGRSRWCFYEGCSWCE